MKLHLPLVFAFVSASALVDVLIDTASIDFAHDNSNGTRRMQRSSYFPAQK